MRCWVVAVVAVIVTGACGGDAVLKPPPAPPTEKQCAWAFDKQMQTALAELRREQPDRNFDGVVGFARTEKRPGFMLTCRLAGDPELVACYRSSATTTDFTQCALDFAKRMAMRVGENPANLRLGDQ